MADLEIMGWREPLLVIVLLILLLLNAAEGSGRGLLPQFEKNSSDILSSSITESHSNSSHNVINENIHFSEQRNEEVKENGGDSDTKEKPLEEQDKEQEQETVNNVGNAGSVLPAGSVSKSSQESIQVSHVKDCDPSHRCADKDRFVACLIVTGEDSLAFSLLIENGGASSLNIEIEAPEFVKLEEPNVQLNPNEHKEVRVSFKDRANDSVIVLKSTEGRCSINLQNMISKGASGALTNFSIRSHLASVFILLSASLLILAAAVARFRLWRTHSQETAGPSFQKMDTSLLVKEADDDEPWDDSWGDGWGDEEAPLTPSKPVTLPSVKGLAARRSNKEGRKD